MKRIFLLVAFFTFSAGLVHSAPQAGHFKKVIYVVFENEDQKNVITNAYFKSLSEQGVNFEKFSATIHPSQGNYIAMVAGDNYGINYDSNVDLNVPHLGDLLEAKNMSWGVYAQGFPGNCFLGSKKGKYARKHVPFLSFKNVTNSPVRCAKIANESNFFSDWTAGKLPNFAMYIPDLKNDGHDTTIDFAANWLKTNFDSAFKDPNLMKDTLVVLTYDENSGSSGNLIYNVFLGPMLKAGAKVSTPNTHYSVLRMIEDEWGLGSLNLHDAQAAPITGIWK